MNRFAISRVIVGLLSLISVGSVLGQATGNHARRVSRAVTTAGWESPLPGPVRLAGPEKISVQKISGHARATGQLASHPRHGHEVEHGNHFVVDPATGTISGGQRHHPHRIIRAPGMTGPTKSGQHHAKHAQTHPPHLSLHKRIQPQPARIPQANGRETWKTPYSYGYFGASAKRHWSMHHGHRDRVTEWRLQ